MHSLNSLEVIFNLLMLVQECARVFRFFVFLEREYACVACKIFFSSCYLC